MSKFRDLDAFDDEHERHLSDDRTVKIVVNRVNNGWHEKNAERLKDPEYLAKLAEGSKSEASVAARKRLKGSADFKKSIKDGLEKFNEKNPDHKQKQIERTNKQSKDPIWLEAVTAGNRKKRLNQEHVAKMDAMYKDDKWKQAHWVGIHNPEARANHKKGVLEKTAKPILSLEHGPFISKHEAAVFYFENKLTLRNSLMSVSSWISAALKKDETLFKRISKEEYIILTGKDL